MSLVSKGKPSISKRQSNYDKPAARSFSTPQDKKRAKYDTDTEHNLLLISSQLKPFRKELPIWKEREILLENIKNAATIVITGEMGSGKSTQIPQFIMEAGLSLDGSIAITQPRRVAAISLAKRVAQEVGTQIGQRVGYSVRFDDFTSRNTIIKYLTDGMLLRESLTDPLLKGYQVVILDEAHERTLRTDILFGMLKRAQKTRAQMVLDGEKVNNLKIIIMSATLDANKFANYFKSSTILTIPGRQFPVTLHYALESQPDYLDAALVTVFQIHTEQPLGDILVFLPGQEDIETLEKLIIDYGATLAPDKQKIIPCSLFAALPAEQQAKVFDPSPRGTRKVILATNIAETSITIRGVRYVVDTGKFKMRKFNHKIGMESLSIQNISKSSANQRMGRAGREADGFCYRLYTKEEYQKLEEDTLPEIKRCNLTSVILMLKALGIDNVLEFEYLDAPPRNSLLRALEQLYVLQALDNQGRITTLGQRMAEFPLEPTFAKVLLSSKELSCTREAIAVISLLSVDSIFFTPQDKREQAVDAKKKFASPLGDLITLLNVLRGYEEQKGDSQWCRQNFINKRNIKHVLDVQKQLLHLCEHIGISAKISCGIDYDKLLKCMVCGFFGNTALIQPNNTYQTITGNQTVAIHPSSVLCNAKAEAVMYIELVLTSKPYMKNVTSVHTSWLQEMMLFKS